MKCLAIGGCHMEGYPIGYTDSFIYQFSKNFASEVHVEANFPLSHSYRIKSLIEHHNPGLVVLQLGNYEFDASIKKTVKLWAKRSAAAGQLEVDGTGRQKGNFVRNISTISKGLNARLISMLQWISFPVTGLFRKYLVTDNVQTLKEIFCQYPSVKFIMLTPLPVEKITDNWVRKRAGNYFKAGSGSSAM